MPCERLGTGLGAGWVALRWPGADSSGWVGSRELVRSRHLGRTSCAPTLQHGGASTCTRASWRCSTCCRGWGARCCAQTSSRGSGKRPGRGRGQGPAGSLRRNPNLPVPPAAWTPPPSSTSASSRPSSTWPSCGASSGESFSGGCREGDWGAGFQVALWACSPPASRLRAPPRGRRRDHAFCLLGMRSRHCSIPASGLGAGGQLRLGPELEEADRVHVCTCTCVQIYVHTRARTHMHAPL